MLACSGLMLPSKAFEAREAFLEYPDMPLEKADLEQIANLVTEKIKPIEEKVTSFGKEFPGMSKRHAEEVREALSKDIQGLKPAPKEPELKPPTTDEKVAKLENELRLRDEKAFKAEVKAEASAAISSLKLVDGAAADVLEQFIPKVQREGEKLIVNVKRKLAESNEELDEKVSVKDAIERHVKARPWLLAGSVKGGTGANGASGSNGTQNSAWRGMTYREIMKDPKLARQAMQEDEALWNQKRLENK